MEAIQYDNLNKAKIEEFVGTSVKQELESNAAYKVGVAPPIFSLTLNWGTKVMPGNYIIKNNSEFIVTKHV